MREKMEVQYKSTDVKEKAIEDINRCENFILIAVHNTGELKGAACHMHVGGDLNLRINLIGALKRMSKELFINSDGSNREDILRELRKLIGDE